MLNNVKQEVKDLQPFITEKIFCLVVSVITSFFINYIPFSMNIPIYLLIITYAVFFLYSYAICLLGYKILIPENKRVNKKDIIEFLINKGEKIDTNQKGKIRYNIFKRIIRYRTKNTKGQETVYIFKLKENTFDRITEIGKGIL